VGLERDSLSFVRIIEELLEWKNSGSGVENRDLTAVGIRCADHATPSIRKRNLVNLFSSPNVIKMMKSRRMRWVGHVACMGAKRNAYRFWWESQKERDHQEDLDVGGRIILNWIVKK
jgi:hypothetical protein